MKLEHMAIYVEDLEGAKDFFVKYFGAHPNDGYHNFATGLCTYFLTFDGEARLELMYRPELVLKDAQTPYLTGLAHLAITVGSKENVDTLTKRLEQDGYTVLSAPRTTGDGYYESCILDKEGNQIEIVA